MLFLFCWNLGFLTFSSEKNPEILSVLLFSAFFSSKITLSLLSKRSIISIYPECCCCSVAKLCLIPYDPRNCSTPGFPILHYLPEFAQTHVHWVSWCHSTVSSSVAPSPIAVSLSQHQSFPMSWLFASGANVLEPQHQSFQKIQWISGNIQGWFPLGLTSLISLQSKGLWGVFSSTTVQKHQFFGIQPSLWSNSHIVHDSWKNHSFDSMDLCQQSDVSAF